MKHEHSLAALCAALGVSRSGCPGWKGGGEKGEWWTGEPQSSHDQPIAPNRLAEEPRPTSPNQAWVSDITHVRTAEGWLCVAAIPDLYSRRIVGWATGESLECPPFHPRLHFALEPLVGHFVARPPADPPLFPSAASQVEVTQLRADDRGGGGD